MKKIRVPKNLIIAGKTYKLLADKTVNGGSFDNFKHEIRYCPAENIEDDLEVILHEIIEGELAVRKMRYQLDYNNPENGSFMFCFNHAQFQEAIADIAFALKPFLK